MLQQMLQVTLMNLRNIRSRLGSSSVIVVGIGGVVAVLIAILAMAAGFRSVLDNTGRDDVAIVLRGGSSGELSSNISPENRAIVSSLPGVVTAAGELFTIVDAPKRSTGAPANLVVRGVQSASFAVRPQLRLLAGRTFSAGKRELIAGRGAAAEFLNVEVGGTLNFRDSTWTVVGIFESGGDAQESELWGDLPVAQSAFRRGGWVTSMRLQVSDPAVIPQLAEIVEKDPRLDLKIVSEREYYASQGKGLSRLITSFGYSVAVIMAIGAIFSALNTMYSAVSSRTIEIATLRAIGFSAAPVLSSVMMESLVLALIGGMLGALVAYIGFNGMTVSTLNSGTFSQLAFDFSVTPDLIAQGLIWSIALGAIGGLFPAVRAVRIPITVALRGE